MFRVAVAGAIVVTSLLLCGCVEAKPVDASPSEVAVGSGMFKSRAAALDAYGKLFKKYISVTNEVTADGGRSPERLRPFVTDAAYRSQAASMQRYTDEGLHVRGLARVTTTRLQSVDLDTGKGAAYFCLDVGDSRVIDASGKDVTSRTRPSKQPLIVTFAEGPLIDTSEAWAGEGVC